MASRRRRDAGNGRCRNETDGQVCLTAKRFAIRSGQRPSLCSSGPYAEGDVTRIRSGDTVSNTATKNAPSIEGQKWPVEYDIIRMRLALFPFGFSGPCKYKKSLGFALISGPSTTAMEE